METPKSINEQIVDTYTKEGFRFPDEPEALDLVIGPDVVMYNKSGYYIGQCCFEYKEDGIVYHGEWVGPLPYSRDTWYMSETEAHELLAIQHKLHSGE
tara:strand:- start:222 stop:515 length:294 start_codon:yes stop_codon:yes gene_type:complete